MTGQITLADGTVIDMTTGRPAGDDSSDVPNGYIELPTATEAVRTVYQTRKKLADLPDIPERMNIIGVVCAYHMFGLSDAEIAIGIGVTESQITNVRMSDAFTSMIAGMTTNLIDNQQDDVRSILAGGATTAAHRMVSEINSNNPQARIVAAKDILDRSGHRAGDLADYNNSMSDGLTIEYITKDHGTNLPKIQIDKSGLEK